MSNKHSKRQPSKPSKLAVLTERIHRQAREIAKNAAIEHIGECESIELKCDGCGKPTPNVELSDCPECGVLCPECTASCWHGFTCKEIRELVAMEAEDRVRQVTELSRKWKLN